MLKIIRDYLIDLCNTCIAERLSDRSICRECGCWFDKNYGGHVKEACFAPGATETANICWKSYCGRCLPPYSEIHVLSDDNRVELRYFREIKATKVRVDVKGRVLKGAGK